MSAENLASWNAHLECERLRAELATALRESAELIAQRDTALGLRKERERELAEVRAERALLETQKSAIARRVLELEDIKPLLDGAELAETRRALEALGADYSTLLGESNAYETALASARAKLAKAEVYRVQAEARVKEIQRECNAWREGCGGVTCG